MIDSDCDCPYKYDCQHLAAVLFYLEEHLDEMVVAYSKETDLRENDDTSMTKEKATFSKHLKKPKPKKMSGKEKNSKRASARIYLCFPSFGAISFFLPEEEVVAR